MQLDEWLASVSAELGTEDFVLDDAAVRTLLDLARDAAHGVERVAAPLTTFLVGLAVGRGQALAEASARAAALALAQDRDETTGRDDPQVSAGRD